MNNTTNKTKVILLSAKAQHGKDFTANIFKEQLESMGKKVLVTHYADLLKYICKTFFGWDGNKDEAGRNLLQHVGTDVIRKQDHNYWVRFINNILNMFPNEWDYVLIPDTRFPNEINYIKNDLSFKTISVRIDRPNFKSILTEEQKKHESETALDNYKFDYYISNTTKESVIAQVNKIINGSMFKPNIFIDADNTIFNTTKRIVEMYDDDYKFYSDYTKVDWKDVYTWDFTELKAAKTEAINHYFNQKRFFNKIEMFSFATYVIYKLSKHYKINIVTHGYSPNLRLKELYFKKKFPFANFIGVNLKEHSDKSCVDMSNGIFIDDSVSNLESSNAKVKICYGTYSWNENWNGIRCKDWLEVKDKLDKIKLEDMYAGN